MIDGFEQAPLERLQVALGKRADGRRAGRSFGRHRGAKRSREHRRLHRERAMGTRDHRRRA